MDHYWPRRPIPIRCRQHRERMASAWDVIEPFVPRKIGYIVSLVFFWMAKKKIMTGQGLSHQLNDFPLLATGSVSTSFLKEFWGSTMIVDNAYFRLSSHD